MSIKDYFGGVYRARGTFSHSNTLGMYLNMWLPIIFAYLFNVKTRLQFVILGVFGIGAGCVILTLSRGSWVTMLMAIAMHSHNYSLSEMRRRYEGEGRADSKIYPAELLPDSWISGVLRPWGMEVARDFLWCVRSGNLKAGFEAPNRQKVIDARDEAIEAMLATWLWFEEQRQGVTIPDFGSYAAMKTIDNVSLTSIPLNILRQYRLLGKAGFSSLLSLAEHPRNRAIRSVPALLARNNNGATVSRLVGGGRNWSEQSNQCLHVWRNM